MSSAKKARHSVLDGAAATAVNGDSNGHPSAIIAPRCTYAGSKGAEECPHIMVRKRERETRNILLLDYR